MFIWRWWGVWKVGSGGDFLADMIINIIIFCLLFALTIAILIPVLAFMAIKAVIFNNREAAAISSSGATGISLSSPSLYQDACPYCGNTQSRDIRPCIRCGR